MTRHKRTPFNLCRFTKVLVTTAFCIFPMLASAGYISSSLEQYNYQTGGSVLTVRSYDAFDEISGPDQFPSVTGLTAKVNNGPAESIAFDAFWNAYKRRQSWGSAAEMVAARPVDATIVQTLQGSPAGAVTIIAPGIAYADAVPVSPLFQVSGISGYWTYNAQGEGILNFNAAAVDSFSVTLNAFVAGTKGGQFFYSASVADVRSSYSRIDEQHSGVLDAGTSAPSFSMTFTRGLPLDGGDADPTTYGFAADSFLLLEGEFGNIFGLSDAGLGDASLKAFIYQNNTSLLLQAVPEPSTYVFVGIGTLLVSCAAGRRSSKRRRPIDG